VTEVLLLVFAVECAALLLWARRAPGRTLEFPFLAGAVFTGWILPQLYGLVFDQLVPQAALAKAIFMTILCAAMCWAGYVLAGRREPGKATWAFHEDRVAVSAALLTAFGVIVFILLQGLPAEMLEASQWSGTPVAYLFFATTFRYGFALALFLYARNRASAALPIAVVGALAYVYLIVFAGRRFYAVEFTLMLLVARWVGWRRAPSWPGMVAALVAASAGVFATGAYRSAMMDHQGPQWATLLDIDLTEGLSNTFQAGGPEMTNATLMIDATDRTGLFDFGISQWNSLVFAYVPAQLIGAEFKASLLVPLPDAAFIVYGHRPFVGSTLTGMTDSFQSFWYLGSLEFAAVGYVLRRLSNAARSGDLRAQVVHALMITNALHAITHYTGWFVTPWVHMGIFLWPALIFATRRAPSWAPAPAPRRMVTA
jgi:hypothetical protein